MLFRVNATVPEAQSQCLNLPILPRPIRQCNINFYVFDLNYRPISTKSSSITSTTALMPSPAGASATTKTFPPNTVSSTWTTKLILGSVVGFGALVVVVAVMVYLYVRREKRREQHAQNIPAHQDFTATYNEPVQQHEN
ncbi:hypothetical protein NA56DRAFT_709588 [Hyaloscypha hepaticicola]|uniref:Mid2 domain-containing protein n=1 Tax=Hyaloscypha hepaticicola TaxID=2082293 RepID=A0A2J6PNW2_9HELO|nr:hypothetical protein NA56DRAFT_709588 [Hyaloscypha hepaticicola]